MSKRFVSATLTAAVLALTGLSTAAAQTAHPPDLPYDPRPDCTPFGIGPIVFQEKVTPAVVPPSCEHYTASMMTVVRHLWQAVSGAPAGGFTFDLNFDEEQEPTPTPPEELKEMPREVPDVEARREFSPTLSFTPSKEDLFPEQEHSLSGGCLTYEWNGWTGSFRTPCTEPPVVPAYPGEDVFEQEEGDHPNLEAARRLFLIGERCRIRGEDDMARNCYEEVRLLCPGSNLAAMAAVRLVTVRDEFQEFLQGILDEPAPPTPEEEQAARAEVEALVRLLNDLAENLTQELEACRPGAQHDGPCYENEHGSPCCPFAHLIPRPVLRETDLQNMKDARDLYFIAERCRLCGDPDMACRFYEEAMEACPASRYAHKAAVRISQIALRRAVEKEAGVEEAEVPPSPHMRRELRPMPMPQWFPMMPPATLPVPPADDRQSKAEELFRHAERCLKADDLKRAYAFYQEVHLICPECAAGRQAIERMAQIEQLQRAVTPAEEQEPPQDDFPEIHIQVKEQPGGLVAGLVTSSAQGAATDELGMIDAANRILQETLHHQRRLMVMKANDLEAGMNWPSCMLVAPLHPTSADWEMIEALDRVLKEVTEVPPAINVTTEESSTPATEGEEEQEPPAADRSAPVYVPADARHLRLVDEDDCCADVRTACLDLSDWLRQVVRTRPSGVHLKIDAARLGRLVSEGEGALRCLGCELVSEGEGRTYVVYPMKDGGR